MNYEETQIYTVDLFKYTQQLMHTLHNTQQRRTEKKSQMGHERTMFPYKTIGTLSAADDSPMHAVGVNFSLFFLLSNFSVGRIQ